MAGDMKDTASLVERQDLERWVLDSENSTMKTATGVLTGGENR